MPERLFLFLQCEFPWALGPSDGRYLLRSEIDGEPERVIVLSTLGAGRAERGSGPLRRRAASRKRSVPSQPEPTPVAIARATIVDPVSLSAERQARAWLADLDAEREVTAGFVVLNRVLHAQRIAAADPYAREVSPAQALTIRVGWGEGEQVAEGRWLHAVELPWADPRARALAGRRFRRAPIGRASALRPDERLAGLLAAREQPLLCEELTLRARLDLDQGRLAHATIELDRALFAALAELEDEQRADLPLRVAELASLRPGVARAARAVLPLSAADSADLDDPTGPADTTSENDSISPSATGDPAPAAPATGAPAGTDEPAAPDEEMIRHALGRLEAALRARTAAGVSRT
jgi:hypothetical protein